MLDIETLGRKPGCVVLSIGVCTFDLENVFADVTYEVLVDPLSCQHLGMEIDHETYSWWQEQDPEVFRRMTSGNVPIQSALRELTEWLGAVGMSEVWAKSPQFDCAILEYAYWRTGLPVPWTYRQPRDLRTLLALVPDDLTAGLTCSAEHDALADAIFQAEQARLALKYLSLGH